MLGKTLYKPVPGRLMQLLTHPGLRKADHPRRLNAYDVNQAHLILWLTNRVKIQGPRAENLPSGDIQSYQGDHCNDGLP